MDDQLARCLVAEDEGWGYVVKNRTEDSIRIGIEKLLNHSSSSTTQQFANGADVLAENLHSKLGEIT